MSIEHRASTPSTGTDDGKNPSNTKECAASTTGSIHLSSTGSAIAPTLVVHYPTGKLPLLPTLLIGPVSLLQATGTERDQVDFFPVDPTLESASHNPMLPLRTNAWREKGDWRSAEQDANDEQKDRPTSNDHAPGEGQCAIDYTLYTTSLHRSTQQEQGTRSKLIL